MALKQRMPEFGRMLREARLDRDLTCKDMARIIGCTPQFASETELGKRIIRRVYAERFIRAYRLPRRAALSAWLDERCRRDRVLGRVRGPLTFMQHCRRRRIELGIGTADVQRALHLSSLTMLEDGTRPPPSRKKAMALLRFLKLPARLWKLARQERIAHRKALFLTPARRFKVPSKLRKVAA
jgi:transcriptional regulator with XRE-family HTH domain